MSTCRSCHEQIQWVRLPSTRKALPLQLQECRPSERGAVFVVDGWGYRLDQLGRHLAQREGVSEVRGRELAVTRYPAYLTHFAKCPHAAQHRKAG